MSGCKLHSFGSGYSPMDESCAYFLPLCSHLGACSHFWSGNGIWSLQRAKNLYTSWSLSASQEDLCFMKFVSCFKLHKFSKMAHLKNYRLIWYKTQMSLRPVTLIWTLFDAVYTYVHTKKRILFHLHQMAIKSGELNKIGEMI
jgi:hypothetical protein